MPVGRHIVRVVIDRPGQLWFVAGQPRNLARLSVSAMLGCGGVFSIHIGLSASAHCQDGSCRQEGGSRHGGDERFNTDKDMLQLPFCRTTLPDTPIGAYALYLRLNGVMDRHTVAGARQDSPPRHVRTYRCCCV